MTKEEINAYQRKRYAANRERSIERQRAYRKANKDRVNATNRRYRQRHPEQIRIMETRSRLRNNGLPPPIPSRPMPQMCELCNGKLGKRSLHLDHDHTTGRFRGWLCHGCNVGLGLFRDSIENLQRAITYLKDNSL